MTGVAGGVTTVGVGVIEAGGVAISVVADEAGSDEGVAGAERSFVVAAGVAIFETGATIALVVATTGATAAVLFVLMFRTFEYAP